MKYTGQITYHFDVWGHEFRDDCPDCGKDACEGWQVNDSRTVRDPVVIYKRADEGGPTEAEVIEALKDRFNLEGCTSDNNDPETFHAPDGKPILTIDWTEERERVKFSVVFEVDETWITDGFDLDDEGATEMLRKRLGYAREDELGAAVTSAPDPELISWFQGGRKVRP